MTDNDHSFREWELILLTLIKEDKYLEIKNIVYKDIINFQLIVGNTFGDKDNKDIFYHNVKELGLEAAVNDTFQDIALKNNKNNALKGLVELTSERPDETETPPLDNAQNVQNVISEKRVNSNNAFGDDRQLNYTNKTERLVSRVRIEDSSDIVYIDGLKHINGWSSVNSKQLIKCLWKLKYNRVINNFYYFNLKAKESFWSWAIIVTSSFIGLVTLGNNINDEPFYGYHTAIKILLTVFSSVMTLIAAWIKKQQYIEIINNVDRYLQKLNKLCEELDIQLILTPVDRLPYIKFREITLPLITEYLASNPLISPTEWKECVYQITKHYPEIIAPDNIDENKLWPWFGISEKGGIEYRPVTKFADSVLSTYEHMHKKRSIKRYLCGCCYKKDDRTIFQDIYNNIESSERNVRMFKRGDKIKVTDKKQLRHVRKGSRRKYVENGLNGTVSSANIVDNKLFYNIIFDSPKLNSNRRVSNEYHNSKIELKEIVVQK